MRFQHSLYGKFFGKPPPFEQVKLSLLAKWADIGEVSISDLPNGLLLIRCDSHNVKQRILVEGPWSINGIVLQLSPWQPFFEPVFAKLTTAAVWVQLHNLPVDFWEAETLESITAHIGSMLKVDDLTSSLVRSRFARVCLEVDLSKPLSRGFWIGDDMHRVFVVILYEKLPTFCYLCGLVGHGSNACPQPVTARMRRSPPPPCFEQKSAVGSNLLPVPPVLMTRSPNHGSDETSALPLPGSGDPGPEKEFGSWLLAPRRRGRVRGRGASTRVMHAAENGAAGTRTVDSAIRSDTPAARGVCSGFSGRDRGGHASSRTPRPGKGSGDVVPLQIAPLDQNQAVYGSFLVSPRDSGPPNDSHFKNSDTLTLQPAPPGLLVPKGCWDKGKAPLLQRSSSPPPVLRIAHMENPPQPPGDLELHLMAVDKVNEALARRDPDVDDPGSSPDDEEEDEGGTGDEEMSEGDDEIDDMMTLDQYQGVQRRDSLVRKKLAVPNDPHKKGRVEVGGSGSS